MIFYGPFWVTGHFEISALNDHRITLSWLVRSGVPHIWYCSPRVSNLSTFPSMTSLFRVTCHFEISALNDPKQTLNTRSSSVYHIMLLVSLSLKFQSVSFYDQPFWSYRPFWGKCTKWPQMTFRITNSKVPHRCFYCPCQFQPVSLYNEPFPIYRPFWDKYVYIERSKIPLNTTNTTRSKVPMYVFLMSQSPKLHPFAWRETICDIFFLIIRNVPNECPNCIH